MGRFLLISGRGAETDVEGMSSTMTLSKKTVGAWLAVFLLTAILGGSPARADDPRGQEMSLDRLREVLRLSVDQMKKLTPILEAFQKVHSARLRATQARIRTILNPEQAARFDQICEQKRNGQRTRHGLKALQEDLGLSSDQVEKIRTFIKEAKDNTTNDRNLFLQQMRIFLSPAQFSRLQDMLRPQAPGSSPSP